MLIRKRSGSSIDRAGHPTTAPCTSHQLAQDEKAERECRYGGFARRDPPVEDEACTGIAS